MAGYIKSLASCGVPRKKRGFSCFKIKKKGVIDGKRVVLKRKRQLKGELKSYPLKKSF